MKKYFASIYFFCALALNPLFAEIPAQLSAFAQYSDGGEKKCVADARAWALGGTDETLPQRLSALSEFVKSGASADAREIAIGWLGSLGGAEAVEALKPSLDERLNKEADAVIAAIKGSAISEIDVSLTDFRRERRHGKLMYMSFEHEELLASLNEGGEKAALALSHLARQEYDKNLEAFLKVYRENAELKAQAFNAVACLAKHASVKEYFRKNLESSDAAVQLEAVEFSQALNDHLAAQKLLEIGLDKSNANSAKALAAYASVAPSKEFFAFLRMFEKDASMQGAVWTFARRVDVELAKTEIYAAMQGAEPAFKAKLQAMHERLSQSPLQRLDPPKEPDTPTNASRASMYPDGHSLAAYINCGPQEDVKSGSVHIRCAAGKNYATGKGAAPYDTVAFDAKALRYEIGGLDDAGEYVLGVSWFDFDSDKRRQGLWANGVCLMPAAALNAYHKDIPAPSRFQIPLEKGLIKGGKLSVEIRKEAGPNAVVSEIWILKKERKDARKKVLIVSGDDYPGHLWRETQDALSAILRKDSNLEVSVSETPYVLGSAALPHYDAVVLHFKNYPQRTLTGKALWDNLSKFVSGGGGLILTHFACGAFEEWKDFVSLSGRVWNPKKRGHDPYGVFQVRVLKPDAAPLNGLKDFEIKDELYTCLDGETPIDTLCAATSKVDGKDYPQAFSLRYGKGRVFSCTLGHDARSYENPHAARLWLSAAKWAAKADE